MHVDVQSFIDVIREDMVDGIVGTVYIPALSSLSVPVYYVVQGKRTGWDGFKACVRKEMNKKV